MSSIRCLLLILGVVLVSQTPMVWAQDTLVPNSMAARVAACTACHGEQGRAGADGYYPRLAGKPQTYLFHQLLNFRDGRRVYQPMTHLLTGLPDAYLNEIARYFAEQTVPYPKPVIESRESLAMLSLGEKLVFQGDASRKIPPCTQCHGQQLNGNRPGIPGLLGLPKDYINAQMGAWQHGLRRAHEPDCMAHIARQLTPEDIAAVAAWLSAQPITEAYLQPLTESPTPVACGSQPSR